MFRSTNVPFDECSVRRMFHSTNVPFNECSVRPMFLRRKCIRRVFSTKVPYPPIRRLARALSQCLFEKTEFGRRVKSSVNPLNSFEEVILHFSVHIPRVVPRTLDLISSLVRGDGWICGIFVAARASRSTSTLPVTSMWLGSGQGTQHKENNFSLLWNLAWIL